MERGPLLRTVASLMFPFMLVLALYLLLNGHNRAGGGFVAGVFMAGAIGLQYLAHGAKGVPGFLRLPYRGIMALGLLVSLAVGSIVLFGSLIREKVRPVEPLVPGPIGVPAAAGTSEVS